MSRSASRQPIRALFLNSAVDGGADTAMHMMIVRNLPIDRVEVHAAAQPGAASRAYQELTTLSHVALRPTYFGPTLWRQSKLQKIASAKNVLPMMASLAGLAGYIRRNSIEIIHSTDRPRDAISCAMLASMTGAKSVVHAHVNYGAWMGRGVRWAFGRADALVGVSRFSAQTFVDAGYDKSRVHCVLNAIELDEWRLGQDQTTGRCSLSVSPDAPLILSVARLFPPKGQRDLLRAVGLVKREMPNVMVAIVGADFPEDCGETDQLRAIASEVGIDNNVIFAGQRADVPSLMAACDVFALPSFLEPFGLVFAEAMAMSRPIVALNNGGSPEVVEHGISGLLSSAGDTEALAANLRRHRGAGGEPPATVAGSCATKASRRKRPPPSRSHVHAATPFGRHLRAVRSNSQLSISDAA